ncbi:3-oxo-tetronate kinase [Streptomyces odontomachi]|uniref:3-oxo-tetronate kinase n=1 Tax=Streptomyces odontomachi TaxID=2944940 RepID=UPI00210B08C7|nr:3-oxo-tetronate kinase [Streptomyces sp. ODS25]
MTVRPATDAELSGPDRAAGAPQPAGTAQPSAPGTAAPDPPRHPLLGCIADDFTGATDLAGNLVRAGYRTTLIVGAREAAPTPGQPPAAAVASAPGPAAGATAAGVRGRGAGETAGPAPGAAGAMPSDAPDAVVVALKTRTVPPEEAVRAALDAHRGLAALGCERFWFKYCSTFDSTPGGNIGPVIDALLAATGAPWTIACPAFPDNGRTVYQGHLFVADRLLSESGMRHHPLTPMTDPDLVRVLAAQTRHPVGLLPHPVLRAGDAALRAHVDRLVADGTRIVVTDVLGNDDFAPLLRATARLPLLTGGSGLALALPPPSGRTPDTAPAAAADPGRAARIPVAAGPAAVLAGSVSDATLAQTAYARARLPHRRIPVDALLDDPEGTVADAVAWARGRAGPRPVLLYSADDRDQVRRAQRRFGTERSAAAVEGALAACARELVDAGFGRLLVAGGETSGAVVTALGVRRFTIGRAIAPGVPWTAAGYRGRTVNLALKSGNFGAEDIFVTAQDVL